MADISGRTLSVILLGIQVQLFVVVFFLYRILGAIRDKDSK